MAYIPQFIPTNTQALQGTLDQYQKASDTQTALQHQANDIYSAIPTTRMYDTGKKNEVMGTFSKTLDELDKKYNYDRSNTQYANELASKITQLRSNPLWAHIQQKDEVDKIRQNLVANRGADYHENFNPNDITLENAQKLQDWKPVDLKDVREASALYAKERAQQVRKTTYDKSSVPGYIFRTEHLGDQDMNEATQYWNSKEGSDKLKQSIISRGFDPNDPVIYNEAYTSALSNSIGGQKTDPLIDRAYVEGLKGSGKENINFPWEKITNTGSTLPVDIKKMSDVQNVESRLKELSTKPNPTDADKTEMTNLQLAKDQVQNVTDEVVGNNQPVITAGKDLVKNIIKDPSINSDDIFEKLRKYYVDTNAFKRFEGSTAVRNAYTNSIQPTSDLVAGVSGVITNALKDILPFFDKDVAKEGIVSSAKLIGRAIGHKNIPVKNYDQLTAAEELTHDIIKENAANGKYGDVHDENNSANSTAAITKDWQTLLPKVYDATNQFEKYYKGKGSFVDNGYNKIEKGVNDKLKSGITFAADIYAPNIDTKPAQYKQFTDFVSHNIDAFEVTASGKTQPMNDKEKQAVDAALSDGKSKIQLIANRETEPVLLMTDSKGVKYKLTMNLNKMGTDVIDDFARTTGRPEFFDGKYKEYKFANRTYTLNDKDPYLRNIISQRYKDATPFAGLSFTKAEDSDGIYYMVQHPAFGDQPVRIKSKYTLMRSLDEIFLDYLNQKSKE